MLLIILSCPYTQGSILISFNGLLIFHEIIITSTNNDNAVFSLRNFQNPCVHFYSHIIGCTILYYIKPKLCASLSVAIPVIEHDPYQNIGSYVHHQLLLRYWFHFLNVWLVRRVAFIFSLMM